jgi:hypothetical protein
MNKRVYNACIGGASSIEMGIKNLLNKNPKEGNKTQNPMDPNQLSDSHADAAKHLCHRAGLSQTLAPRKNLEPEISGSHNHRGT